MLTNEYLMGPAIAMGAVGVLSLVLRWMYNDSPPRRPASRPKPADYGLLVPVATIADRGAAASLQSLLAGHGIRATLAPAAVGGVQVLVFPVDEERARALLTPSG